MRLRAVVLGIAVALALIAVAFGRQLVPIALAQGIGLGTGTAIAYDSITYSATQATLTNVRVHSRRGEPIAEIARVDVRYNLRALLPGSRRRYGLEAISIDRPVVTIVRHADGTTNLPSNNNAQPSGPPPQAAPFNFTAQVRDGSVSVLDEGIKDRRHRYLYLEHLDGDATFATAARTTYAINLAYREGVTRYPVRGVAVIDAGAMMQHWTAAKIPLPQLLEYAMRSPNISVQAGSLDNVDLRYFGVADNTGAMRSNLTGTAVLDGMRIAMAGIAKPLRDLHGTITISDRGLLAQHLDGRLAGVPLAMSGGMFDFGQPRLRLSVHGNGDVAQLRSLVATRIPQAASGPVAFDLRVEGSASKPLVLAAFTSPRVRYGDMPFGSPQGLIAIAGHEADVFRLTTRYQGVDVQGRGRIAFQREPSAVELYASADGRSDRIPYASALVQNLPVHASVFATGDDPKQIQTQGLVNGSADAQRLVAAFRVNTAGTGTVSPIEVAAGGRSLYGNLRIDRPHNTLGGLVSARAFRVQPAGSVALTGLHVPALPQIAGTLDGNVFAQKKGYALDAIGALDVSDARVNAVPVSQVHVAFSGPALRADYTGSVAALASIAGGKLPASGTVHVPVSILFDGQRVIAQIDRAQFTNANVSGIALHDFSATLAARKDDVQIYAADAHVAHRGEVLASGSLGRRNNVAVSVAQVGISGGLANGGADIGGTMNAPRARGAALLRGATVRGYPLNASGSFAYANSGLALNGATVALGPAYASVDGVVTPFLDLHATVQGADARALAALAQPKLAQQVTGTVNADVRVSGSAAAPFVAGAVDLPEGSYHGLAFRDLRTSLRGNARMLDFSGGSVLVGSTVVAFTGSAGSAGIAGSIDAPHANLADFDDYFDTADTLGGHGSIRASYANARGAIASSGDIALADARYRRIPIGAADAHWRSAGSRVVGSADVGGESGRLRFNGSATLARSADIRGRMIARNVDLRTWLPLAGVRAPVTGFVNGDADISGAFPDVDIAARAAVAHGTVGRVALQRFDVVANVVRGRGQLRAAHLQIPYLAADANGAFGLHPRDPLSLSVNAQSPNLAMLAKTIAGRSVDAGGSLRTTAHISGTLANPQVADKFSLDNLRYNALRVPRIHGTIAATRSTIAARNIQAELERGAVALDGLVDNRGRGNLTLTATDVEASNFVSLFPRGTKMNGRVDGTLNVRGTTHAPQFGGTLALRDGSYVGPLEREPITGAHAQLAFAGTGVTLRDTSARVGGGTVNASGRASFKNLHDPKSLAFDLGANAERARFDMPQYLRGEVNGDLAITHAPASRTMVAGNIDIPSARMPLTLFYNPKAPQTPSGPAPDVGFNLHVNVGNDVRVQSSNVDVGAQGALAVSGTLAHPMLAGDLASTGGTLDFFRRFTVEQGTLHFDNAYGIMPEVDAVATTSIPDPQTNVALHVTGLAPSSLNIAFESDPSYNRQQILGLLVNAQAIGAAPGVQKTNSGQPFGASNQIQNLAMGQVNTLFTRSLLEPLSAQIGQQLGFENFQLTGDFTGGLGLSAAKVFGKNLTAMFSENLGTPRRQSIDVRAHGKKDSAIDLTMYQSDNPNVIGLFSQSSTTGMNAFSNSTVPLFTGTNGFTLTYGHLWQ